MAAARQSRSPFVGLALALAALALVAVAAVALGGNDATAPRAARTSIPDHSPAGAITTTTAASAPATVATTAAAASTAAEQLVVRSLAGGCIPVPGGPACDVLRAAMWNGDLDAWQQWAALQGHPPPTPAEAQAGAIALRLSAGDPAARIDFARATGQPLPLITRVRLRGRGEERRVAAVEISNLGAVPADLTGIMLAAGIGPLGPGLPLAPGSRCEIGPEARTLCPGAAISGAGPLLLPGSALRLLAPGGRVLDELIIL